MTHWSLPKSTTWPRQLSQPFTTSRCQMFYPPISRIECIPLYRKSPFPRLCKTNLTRTTHPKLLTAPKVPKKKKKKQKDEWNKSPDVSNDEYTMTPRYQRFVTKLTMYGSNVLQRSAIA
uniref:Uncharacterized protein n=1 Tax=Romanomermis culicivorax TaxID=13658 RepID=A0A915K0F0_ROMCU